MRSVLESDDDDNGNTEDVKEKATPQPINLSKNHCVSPLTDPALLELLTHRPHASRTNKKENTNI